MASDKEQFRRPPRLSERHINRTTLRVVWAAHNRDPEVATAVVEEDTRYSPHLLVSTPCLSGTDKAEGVWIENLAGRRYLEVHGNSVHQIGYGHPRLIAAIKRQRDRLHFMPRRITCARTVEYAHKLGKPSPGTLSKMPLNIGCAGPVEVAARIVRAATSGLKMVAF